MATKDKIIVPGTEIWTLITSATDFLVTNNSQYAVTVCFSAGVPGANISGHALHKDDGLVRNGLSGDVYIKSGHQAEIACTE